MIANKLQTFKNAKKKKKSPDISLFSCYDIERKRNLIGARNIKKTVEIRRNSRTYIQLTISRALIDESENVIEIKQKGELTLGKLSWNRRRMMM